MKPAWRWLIVAIALPALFFLSRAGASADEAISAAEAATWIKDDKAVQLIDVRTRTEYAGGHLAGAKLIPVQELAQRLSEVDKARPVLLYCRTGHRSAYALEILEDHGYTDVKHIRGGIMAWRSAGLPMTR